MIAIGCPTATSFEPSGASILAKNLEITPDKNIFLWPKKTNTSNCKTNTELEGNSFIIYKSKQDTHGMECLLLQRLKT